MHFRGMTATRSSDEFTRGDRRRLARALAQARVVRVYRRVEAVLLVAEGRSARAAARQVRTNPRNVQRWVARYLATHHPASLEDEPRTGRPRAVGHLTDREFAAVLRRDPRTLGFRATTWTVALLARYCAERFDCTLTPRTLRRRLREHGFRWKRPRYRYANRATHLAQKKGLSAVA
jgi:transposase